MITLSNNEVVADSVEKVNRLTAYFTSKIPDLIQFGIKVVITLVLFYIGHRLINWLRKIVRMSMERAGADKGIRQFADSFMKFGLHVFLVILLANGLGIESTSTAALIASAGMGISLALQGSLSNLAGGILILLVKPFVVGDYIKEDANGNEGTVSEIQICYTRLSTLDNRTIVIPNGVLANTSITNVTANEHRQLDLRVGISYQADLKAAKNVLEELLLADASVIQEMPHVVFVDSLGDSAVNLGLRAWVKADEYWTVRWRMLENMKLELDKNGIEIPFNQLQIHMDQKQE